MLSAGRLADLAILPSRAPPIVYFSAMNTPGTLARSNVTRIARPTRLSGVSLVVALGAVLVSASLVAGAGAAQQKTCATLKGKHLAARGGRATVVTQLINRESERSGIERVAYVCASPRGRAWPAGSVSAPIEPPGIAVVAGAGEWVVLRFESETGEAFGESESAANALTGKHFQFWSIGGGMGSFDGSPLEVVQLDAQGRLALILGVEGTPTNEGEQGPIVKRKVVGVEANGKRKLLDTAPTASIPTSSLKLVGGVVHWTDAGVERTAAP
jgi:hypothetical protein